MSAESTTRLATLADAAEIARIHVDTWQVAYRGQIPDATLDNLDRERRFQVWSEILVAPQHSVWVAMAGDEMAGFCDLIPSRDEDASETTGEIAAIYIHPDHWRCGHAQRLFEAARDKAIERGFKELTLWVLDTNLQAQQYYEAMGFQADGAKKVEQRPTYEMHELRYRQSIAETGSG